TAAFAGNAYYKAAAGTAAIVIDKADAVVQVTGTHVVCDGLAHDASGSVSGAGGAGLGVPTFTYTDAANVTVADPIHAGSYTVTAAFAGNADYNPAAGTAAIVIDKADAVVQVTGTHVVYDGLSHDASGSVSGVGGAGLGVPA